MAVGAAAMSMSRGAAAEGLPVASASLQAGLLAKIVSYDRNFSARAIDRAKLLLVAKSGDGRSLQAVRDIERAFSSIATVGGLPHSEEVTHFTDAATLASTCDSHRISIVYLGPGFTGEIDGIRQALTSLDVLSVAADPDYVPRGIVLGFAFVSDSVRMLLNRSQARAQHVSFGSRILSRMTIYDP